MLRVRDGSGLERVFDKSAELAEAITMGEVPAGSEVFHSPTNAWFPVESHPAYPTALPSTSATEKLAEGTLGAAPEAATSGAGGPEPFRSRAGQLRTMLALAMGVGVIGAGAVLRESLVAAPRGEEPKPVAVSAPAAAMDAHAWDEVLRPSLPLPIARPAGDSLAAPTGAVVSRLGASRSSILPSYAEAYAEARQDFLDGLEYVGFQQVFGTARLATEDSLRATRRRLRAADNLLRSYRGQEVLLEASYQIGSPDTPATLREPFEPAEAARRLLADADTMVGLLQAEQGRFTLMAGGIRFQDARARLRYGALRDAFLSSMSASDDSLPVPTRFTLHSLTAALQDPPPPAPLN